jgi:hypothetical protein
MKLPTKIQYTKYSILAALFLLAFLERTVFDLGPNIELVTFAMLLASCYFGRRQSFWLIFFVMLTTDLVIGNTNIFIFTWTGFLIPALILPTVFQINRLKGLKKILQGSFLGAGANFFFFIWTNFGVWLLDSWNMYPDTIQGLVMSYINALPFWKYQLTSTLLFATAGFTIAEVAIAVSKRKLLTKSRVFS